MATLQDKINPFPGLRPFQKNESHLFFGRQNHLEEILRKLEIFRFVTVVGNSGSGKSSLISAGVLPKIEKEGWLLCVMRPGKDPIKEICTALFDKNLFGSNHAEEQKRKMSEGVEILNRSKLGLVQLIRGLLPEGKKLLILVDQFEEIFRYTSIQPEEMSADSSDHFVDLLLSTIGQVEVPVYAILTLRSDFLGDCEQFMGLPEAINNGQFLIPRMTREELESCITGPVEMADAKISPNLVHSLLNDVSSKPDKLPVLQHALMRTWDVWQRGNNPAKPIDMDEYEITGGMEHALNNHAEEAYAELNTDRKRKLAETIFKTITLKGNDNRGIRRPTSIGKIILIAQSNLNEIADVVNIFRSADRGFIMPISSVALTEKSILDISHESLMRVWERLHKWVEDEADSAEIYQRICENASLYDKNMAGLWRDPDLQIAIEWRDMNKPNEYWADQYNLQFELATRFIDASIQETQYELAEKSRRRKITQLVLSIFLIALSALTLWAFVERNQSVKSEQVALFEKQKAEQQEGIAKEQRRAAEVSSVLAQNERNKAVEQEGIAKEQRRAAEASSVLAQNERNNALEQRKIAVRNAREAEIQKLQAEKAKLTADDSRRAAEIDKTIAIAQKLLSDSLRVIAAESEMNAYRLRMLSIASNMAIKSALAKKGTFDDDVKPLLALQANKFHKEYKGKPFDPDIYKALFSSTRFIQNKTIYYQNLHSDVVKSVAYSPDGKSIVSAGNDGKLFSCNAVNLQANPVNYLSQPLIYDAIQFNKDGGKMAASTDKMTVLIFYTSKPEQKPKEIKDLHTEKISALAWYKNQLITAGFDRKVLIVDESNSKVVKTIILPSKPLSLSVNENDNLLAIGAEDGTVYLYNFNSGSEVTPAIKLNSGKAMAVDVNQNGSLIACGSSDGKIIIFHSQIPYTVAATITAHSANITRVAFCPDGNILASSSWDGTIKLWNINTPDDQPVVFDEHDSWVWCIAFSPDGSQLASCGKDKTVRSYPISKTKMVATLEAAVQRNFTHSEWEKFIDKDVPYERTIH